MTTIEPKPRRRYSAAQREEILTDAASLGVMEAVRKHGVPQTTISTWRRRYGVEPEAPSPSPQRSVESPTLVADESKARGRVGQDSSRQIRRAGLSTLTCLPWATNAVVPHA